MLLSGRIQDAGSCLTSDTAQRVLRDWREALPDEVIVAGVGSRNSNLRAGNRSHGGNGGACRPSRGRRSAGLSADLVARTLPLRPINRRTSRTRRRASGLPLILFYLYEAAGGIAYSPTVLDELLDLPDVVGIKMATLDSVMTYQDVSRQLRERHPEKLFITGEDRFLGYSLQRGARAALIGMGSICCDLQAELIRAHAAGDSRAFSGAVRRR